MRCVLAIGGSDPSALAGVQADLAALRALGVRGTCAITAVTAQNSTRVFDVQPVDAQLVAAQLKAVTDDGPVHAYKSGVLGSPEAAHVIADHLAKHPSV